MTGSQDRANVFICPSYQRVIKSLKGPVYVLNQKQIADLGQTPFGDPDMPKDPVVKAAVSTWMDTEVGTGDRQVDLTRTWAIKDADQQDFSGPNAATAPASVGQMAPTPVHGDHRNALFYDWHVGKLGVDTTNKDQPK
jgi:prepilin-type processing-associated H-X9-DG protein